MAPPVSQCQRCQTRLGLGDAPAFATLRLEEGAVCREDLCSACFEAMTPRPTTFWRRAPRPDAAPLATRDRRRARTTRLLDLFVELAPDPRSSVQEDGPTVDDPSVVAKRKLRYLAALALVRRRRLTLLQSDRGAEADALIVRLPGSRERIVVECPRIAPGELEPLLASLGQALQGGLDAPTDQEITGADPRGEQP